MWRIIKILISAPFVFLAAAILAFEDWLWRPILQWLRSLAKWKIIKAFEIAVGRFPPWPALLLFAVPALLLLPFKLVALYLIAHGKKFLGLAVFVIAKIVGTATVAWIYTLTEPALAKLAWFVTLRTKFLSFKAWAYEQVRSSLVWRVTRRKVYALKISVRTWFRARN